MQKRLLSLASANVLALLASALLTVCGGCVSNGGAAPPSRRSLQTILEETSHEFSQLPSARRQIVSRSGAADNANRRAAVATTFQPGIAAQRIHPPLPRAHQLASFQGGASGGAAMAIPTAVVAGDEGALVSDTFIDSDLRQAIQSIAAQAKVDVVLADDVAGLADAVFQNEPFERALRRLLTPAGCVYRKSGDNYLIGTTNPESEMFPMLSAIYDYQVQHRSPTSLIELLPARHQKFVRTSENSSLILVEAPREIALRILESLQYADRAAPQVDLTVMVCVYSPETSFRFGFDMEHGVSLTGEAAKIAMSGLSLSGVLGPAGFSSLNDFSHTSLVLQALQQEGYLSIKAAPRVMSRDGQKATIQIGRESYFSVQQAGASQILRNDIERVESGIMLDLTPVIRGDRVTIQIDRAEVSEDIRTGDSASIAQYPVINRRRVSTSVHVGDGETVVIGGLTQTQIVDNQIKIPLLGDIPLAGHLFRRIEKQNSVSEIAIFISPRIVRLDTDAHTNPQAQPYKHQPAGNSGPSMFPAAGGATDWAEPPAQWFRE